MKHQQVVVDYWNMVKISCTCLLLALSGYILIKMVQIIFWLPGYLQNNQKRLEDLANKYSVDLNIDDKESGDAITELLKDSEVTKDTNENKEVKKDK